MEDNEKNDLIAAIRQAASSNSTRSKTACLRDIFYEVEVALAKGVKHKQMVAILQKQGLVFTLRSFQGSRDRIAKENGVKAKPQADQQADKSGNPLAITADSNSKNKKPAPALKELEVGPDLSLGDEIYDQFRKKD